jgi:predicted metal-dependent phosphoesterase TrpH
LDNRVDLHCHTTASDGGLSPQELVARSAALGLEVVAVTDHDTTEAVPAAIAAAAQVSNLTIVPGVEISTVSGQEEIHILGYFMDLDNRELQDLLARTQQARRERAEKMLARLAKLGFPIEWEHLMALSGGSQSIGRPHVAAALEEAGYVSSWDEAFDLWIGRGRPAYVERLRLPPEEAIRLLRWSGGLPVLAHPYFYSRAGECRAALDLGRWLPRLRKAGLVGIEIYYPNYPNRAIRQLLEEAIQHGLLITGGSDCHGGPAGSSLGSVTVPWAAWEGLARRHESNKKKV